MWHCCMWVLSVLGDYIGRSGPRIGNLGIWVGREFVSGVTNACLMPENWGVFLCTVSWGVLFWGEFGSYHCPCLWALCTHLAAGELLTLSCCLSSRSSIPPNSSLPSLRSSPSQLGSTPRRSWVLLPTCFAWALMEGLGHGLIYIDLPRGVAKMFSKRWGWSCKCLLCLAVPGCVCARVWERWGRMDRSCKYDTLAHLGLRSLLLRTFLTLVFSSL
jgi:hypothetical protein